MSCEHLDATEKRWLEQEVDRLLGLHVWEEAPAGERSHISRVFLVRKSNWTPEAPKYRMVIDLRPVNEYCPEGTCRVEGLRELPNILRPGDHLTAIDLTDGYFHLSIHPDSRRYTTFHLAGIGYFRCVGMPFGWNLAPGHFCRLLEPVIRHLRSPGWTTGSHAPGERLLWYLDDLLLMHRTKAGSRELTGRVLRLLSRLGLSVNLGKCTLEPTHCLKHLGLVVDSRLGTFGLDMAKMQRLRGGAKQMLRDVRDDGRVRAKQVASLLGLAEFCSTAVPYMRLHLRALYNALPHDNWTGFAPLGYQARRDLVWLSTLSFAEAVKAIWPAAPTATLYTDASTFGWGALLDGAPARGFFTLVESSYHINVLETKALTRALQVFGPDRRGLVVQHFIDSMAARGAATNMTSRSPEMMDALRELYVELIRWRWDVRSEWLSTLANFRADGLSREVDSADWQLNPAVFRALGGGHTFSIDRFASDTNALLPRFNSRWRCPGTAGVDALLQTDWALEVSWCNPPWPLLAPLAAVLLRTDARAAVVAPFWPSAPWRATLFELADWIVDLPAASDLFVQTSARAAKHPPPRWRTQVYLIHVPRPQGSGWLRTVRPGGRATSSARHGAAPRGHVTSSPSPPDLASPLPMRDVWWSL